MHKDLTLPVAPPRGERGLKYICPREDFEALGRSPSWGAWIEMHLTRVCACRHQVAPPRGERGLKYLMSP